MPSKLYGSVKVSYPALDRNELVLRIKEIVPILEKKLPLKRVVLFGSYARGEHTAASDIDLLVVYTGPVQPNSFATVKKIMMLPRLEPHVYSEEEYTVVAETIDLMLAQGCVEIFDAKQTNS